MKQGTTIQERLKDLRTERHLKLEDLAAGTEIYVDCIATMHFKDFNSLPEVLREQVLSKYQPVKEDTVLKALEALQIHEEDYFCQITHRTWDAILHDIRTVHQDDTDSASDDSNTLKLIRDAQSAMAMPGSYLDVFTALMCTQLEIRYEKLTEQERTALKNIMKKSPAYKDSPLSRMKRG